nr:DISARM system helicase DrmA [Desulfacinum infernum]
MDETTLLLDGLLAVDPARPSVDLGISGPLSTAAVSRLEWSVFENALKVACGIEFSAFPVLDGRTPKEQAYIRDLLQWAVVDDLLGPADGPVEEIVGMSVRDRYLVGKLAPPDTRLPDDQVEELPDAATTDPDGADRESEASTSQSLVPSSFGFTFCVDASVESIEIRATWGRYERTESERIDERTGRPFRCWKRIPSGGTATVSLDRRIVEPIVVDRNCPDVVVQGTVGAPLENGDRLVTLFLVNNQEKPDENQDQAWVFQPELVVRDPEGRAIFRRRPLMANIGSDQEREALEMIYRRRIEFAVGHGVSVHATPSDENPERALEVRTRVVPRYEVAVTETPGTSPDDRPAMRRLVADGSLDMLRLAEMERDSLVSILNVLADDYASWIEEQRGRIGTEVCGFDSSARMALDRCEAILERLREGITVLGSDDAALDAFRFANRAMASQRIHSVYSLRVRRGESTDLASLDVPENRSWRPFQLAFLLLSVPALANPVHCDRTEPIEAYADLLWFPTGGGKTEAYLGVAAFTMAIRRLQGDLGGFDGGRGLAVIMRYTLRLLTIQQFQRATTLICAMEVLRRSDTAKWGTEPFTIGLWVGQRVTPNTTKDSHEAIEREREGKYGTGSTPAQLTFCPWCGSEIVSGRDIRVDRDIGRTFIYCGDKYGRCEFGRSKSPDLGLPVLVVDDEIYRHPPSMLIATVDKFAMMAWRGQVRTLFGRATSECPRHGLLWPGADCTGNHRKKGTLPATTVREIVPIRPPDLIIQDEFHLISGPLGTMVGLYETAVDELCTWSVDGKTVRPKIVASTATVRKADEQVNNVFLRRVAVFPPHGLDVEDNFFSVQRSVEKKPGRRYIGICSPGSSRPAVLIRVYVALLTAAQSLFEKFGQAADPYMTLVGYFNSLRELGGMRRLAEDDVQTRSYRVQMSDVLRPGLSQRSIRNVDELTSRVSNKDIPKKLDQLEVKFKSIWAKGETRAIDIVLATNMLSVGVDVNRLGLMVVNGQPKNTAEYIQATSRVGRVFPGLVCTVLTWSRPRDLSHYETFEHYHATFYKHVEAQSVTPFAPRALDRGLTGTMVSLLRLENDPLNPNLGAQSLDNPGKTEAAVVRKVLSERAWKVKDKAAGKRADTMLADRIDRWVKEALKTGRKLGYEIERGQGDVAALLKKPGATTWDEFTVPFSMREVEPGVRLVMDVARLADPPPWRARLRDAESDGGDA